MENTAINRAGQMVDNLMVLTYLLQLIEALEFMPDEDIEQALKKITALSIAGEA